MHIKKLLIASALLLAAQAQGADTSILDAARKDGRVALYANIKLSALGIIMIAISTALVVGANLVGSRFRIAAE